MTTQWILLVMEDGIFHEESVCYAIKLARRIHCSISVLMLAANTEKDSGNTDNEQVLKRIMNLIKGENIPAQGQIRSGDKASEFLKHLADNPSFLTIVWGGEKIIFPDKNKKKSVHWFAKIKTNIRCPVVRPSVKDKAGIKLQRKE